MVRNLFLFPLLFIPLVAQEAPRTLAEEFTRLEYQLRKRQLSPEEKKKNLEKNMISSVKNTLGHRLENPFKELKDLKFQDLAMEKSQDPRIYFVKYKEYYFQYLFPVDPELYLTNPLEEKFLEKPPGMDLAGAHSEEKK